MTLLLLGLLLLAFGCSLIFARNAWWIVQELTNQMQGQVSERTFVWEVSQMGLGVIAIGLSIALIWQGIDRIAQPIIPGICVTIPSSSAFDDADKLGIRRDIRTGCTAAEKKEYSLALSHFRQAANKIERDKTFYSYRDPLFKAIELMNQQIRK